MIVELFCFPFQSRDLSQRPGEEAVLNMQHAKVTLVFLNSVLAERGVTLNLDPSTLFAPSTRRIMG